jgi:capreomycidine synthase
MGLSTALLEAWMREYYFATELDLGSSGVEDFSMAEVRALTGLTLDDLDSLVFHDSETQGNPELREVIAQGFTDDGDPQRVMITHGSTESNFMLMHALLKPDDEVVVLDPCYQQLYGIAEAIGCQLRHWKLRWDRGFQPNLDGLREVLSERTRMVVVNFPHNPTGACLTLEQQTELIEVIRPTGAYLIWDAAFEAMQYDAPQLPSPSEVYERAFSMSTFSKCYGLPGLRVGWSIGDFKVFERCFLLRDYTTLHLSPLVELIARRVMEKKELFVAPRLYQARKNLALVESWAADHREWIEWVSPRGGVSAFPRLVHHENSEDFCHMMGQVHKVLLVPGTCFGHPQHVRLGFGGATDRLEEGLGRLSQGLKGSPPAASMNAL